MPSPEEENLTAFLKELTGETDRGLAVVAAAVIDDLLGDALRAFFCDDGAVKGLLDNDRALGTFSARIDACLALGLIEDIEHHEISIVRRVRNEFAHAKHGTSFKSQKISHLSGNLKSETSSLQPGRRFTPRWLFVNAVGQIVVRLHRALEAANPQSCQLAARLSRYHQSRSRSVGLG